MNRLITGAAAGAAVGVAVQKLALFPAQGDFDMSGLGKTLVLGALAGAFVPGQGSRALGGLLGAITSVAALYTVSRSGQSSGKMRWKNARPSGFGASNRGYTPNQYDDQGLPGAGANAYRGGRRHEFFDDVGLPGAGGN